MNTWDCALLIKVGCYLSLFCFLFFSGLAGAGESSPEELCKKYLPSGASYEEKLSQSYVKSVKRIGQGVRAGKKSVFIFSLPASYEGARQFLLEHGVDWAELDKGLALRSGDSRKDGIVNPKRPLPHPLNDPAYRRGWGKTEEGWEVTLENKHFDGVKKDWVEKTLLIFALPD